MLNYDQFAEYVVAPTLKSVQLWSPAAETLLMGTVAVESRGGHFLCQVGGPALGAFQIEPATHADVWENYLRFRPDRIAQLDDALGIDAQPADEALVFNLAYACYVARIIYLRVPHPLPHADDLEGLARYWKDHYNTHLGKGTMKKWLAALEKWKHD